MLLNDIFILGWQFWARFSGALHTLSYIWQCENVWRSEVKPKFKIFSHRLLVLESALKCLPELRGFPSLSPMKTKQQQTLLWKFGVRWPLLSSVFGAAEGLYLKISIRALFIPLVSLSMNFYTQLKEAHFDIGWCKWMINFNHNSCEMSQKDKRERERVSFLSGEISWCWWFRQCQNKRAPVLVWFSCQEVAVTFSCGACPMFSVWKTRPYFSRHISCWP